MLTQSEMLELLYDYAGEPIAGIEPLFQVVEVVQMAVGIIAVKDMDGECCIFFDASTYRCLEPQLSEQPSRLPKELGMMVESQSKNFIRIGLMGKKFIGRIDGDDIEWLGAPEPLTYPPEMDTP